MTLIDRPFFLVGAERSGTTLLRLMLDHHPRIAFNLESEFLVSCISSDGAYPDTHFYADWLRAHRGFQHSRFSIDESLSYVDLVNDFLNQKRARDGKEIVGATVHYDFPKLKKIWPRARYIYLLRDGRDVANSVVQMGWAGNAYVAADHWIRAEDEWNQLRPGLDRNQWIEVRYEHLTANTKSELERICVFMGVDYSEHMFDYAKTTSYRVPDPSNNYRWKKTLGRGDVQCVEAKIGDRLRSRGYELSSYPRISLTRLARKRLEIMSRVKAFRFRLRRYGASLALRETLSRRLGLHGLHDGVMRHINRIDDANLM
jgi:hypothetical protein